MEKSTQAETEKVPVVIQVETIMARSRVWAAKVGRRELLPSYVIE